MDGYLAKLQLNPLDGSSLRSTCHSLSVDAVTLPEFDQRQVLRLAHSFGAFPVLDRFLGIALCQPSSVRLPGAFRLEAYNLSRGQKYWEASNIRVPALYSFIAEVLSFID